MRTDPLTAQVKRTVEEFAEEVEDGPIELLFVGQQTVWLVLSVDRMERTDALIEVFQAVESIQGVETLFVARADADRPLSDHESNAG
ncbi:MAG: hypothetical protein ABEJ86_02320 [Halococcoides sp.]